IPALPPCARGRAGVHSVGRSPRSPSREVLPMREPMDYIYFVFGGGMTAFDWTTLIALLAISVVYFIAPAVGYPTSGRGLTFASMWLLLANLGLSLLQVTIIFFAPVDNKSRR